MEFQSTYLSCNSGYNGILTLRNGVDTYLQQVNKAFCTLDCPCYFTNLLDFCPIQPLLPTIIPGQRLKIQLEMFPFHCSITVKFNALDITRKLDSNLENMGTFDPISFAGYMGFVGNFFYCTGWCNSTYHHILNNKTEVFYIYMFTDINKGSPVHTRCLMPMVNWLLPYLGAWGSLAIALSIIKIAVFVITMLQIKQQNNELEEQYIIMKRINNKTEDNFVYIN